MQNINYLLGFLALLFFGMGLFFLTQPSNNKQNPVSAFAKLGALSPDIVATDPSGKKLKLSNLRGHYVLLDFWASWCKPCREKHPVLTALYKKYRDTELENNSHFRVFSFSLDTKSGSWEKAIEKDQLIWQDHASDLQGWNSSTVNTFKIEHIPANFLLNPDGIIIRENIALDSLDRLLATITAN